MARSRFKIILINSDGAAYVVMSARSAISASPLVIPAEQAITLLPAMPLPLFRHPGESRGPGAIGKLLALWPLDPGFRRD